MREQTGVVFIAIGAVLVWALDLDIPYVYVRALGWVLLVAGALAVAAAVIQAVLQVRAPIGLGLTLFTVGALVAFAIDVDVPYVLEDELGAILALAGLVTMAAQVAMAAQRQRPRRVREARPQRAPAEPRGVEEPRPPRRDDRHGPPTQKMRPWQR
jgi:hypothetical protein